jgi:MFS family permease
MTAQAYARRYAALTGLRWFAVGLVVPVLVLLLQARGLSLAQVGQLMALYGATVVVLELPTGGLADSIGRRPVLAASSLLTAGGSAVLALVGSWWPLVVAMVLLGTGRALGSGPLEAWYVDAVRGPDPDADIGTGISRAQAVEAISLGVGALVGAVPGRGRDPAGACAGGGGRRRRAVGRCREGPC